MASSPEELRRRRLARWPKIRDSRTPEQARSASERSTNWARNNRERHREHQKNYETRHPMPPERRAEISRNWYSRNKSRVALYRAMHRPETAARARARRATPAWADRAAISMIYRVAEVIRITGFDVEVDHFIPIKGKLVSGLHVHNNLQIILTTANRRKGNRITDDMLEHESPKLSVA